MQWWCIIVITPFAYKIFGWVAMHKKHFLHIKRGWMKVAPAPARHHYSSKLHGVFFSDTSQYFSEDISFPCSFLYIFGPHTIFYPFLIFNPFSSTKLWLRLRGKLVSQINCIIIIDFFSDSLANSNSQFYSFYLPFFLQSWTKLCLKF